MISQPSLLANALIILGEGFWVVSASAQLRKTVKTRNVHGLSAPSQILYAAGNVGWCTYFALNHLWYPFVTNIMLFTLSVSLVRYILSNKKQFNRGLLTILIVGPLTSYMLLAYPEVSGWVSMMYNWIAGSPWLYHVVKNKRVSGMSEHSLYFALGAMACVLGYGIIIHSLPLIACIIQAGTYQLIILRYYYRHRHND